MAQLTEYRTVFQRFIESGDNTLGYFEDYLRLLRRSKEELSETQKVRDFWLKVTDYAINVIEHIVMRMIDNDPVTCARYDKLRWELLLFRAPWHFESFMIYMEKNRPNDRKFYEPRKRTLHIVAEELQNLEDRKYKFLGVSLPPRVGKSTICMFFIAHVMGKRPNSHNAMSGHSGILADGFYSEALNLILSEEYTFSEIFPHVKLQKKSADKKEVNLDKPDRFATLTCRGIDGTWTGAVDISADGYLYVDDLVRDRTESLSPTRLENRYQDYLNVLVDRKNDGSRELMVGTRWNVLDPLGRVKEQFKNDPQYHFLRIPALNENGESNFDYDYGKGFSTEYFLEVKSRLDNNEWMAKYQQRPYVREGLLFPPDELRWYNGILPEGDYRTVSAVDVAWGGGDSLSMPVAREYDNGDVYVYAWVHNKGKKEETLPLVVGQIMNNDIRQIRFEGNNGGELYRQYVDERLREHGYRCATSDRKAPTTMAKMEKMIAYSGDIKRRFLFLEEKQWTQEYRDAMEELMMVVTIGKTEHDDSADALTQLDMFLEGVGMAKPSIVINSPI